MREEAAGGEFLRHHQSSSAVDWHQRAQELRRGPVERPEVIQTIVGSDAKASGRRIDVEKMLAIAEHNAFRLRTGAGSEQDHGVVVRPGVGTRVGRGAAGGLAKECVGSRGIPTSELHSRRRYSVKEIVEPQAALAKHQLWHEPREDVVE